MGLLNETVIEAIEFLESEKADDARDIINKKLYGGKGRPKHGPEEYFMALLKRDFKRLNGTFKEIDGHVWAAFRWLRQRRGNLPAPTDSAKKQLILARDKVADLKEILRRILSEAIKLD